MSGPSRGVIAQVRFDHPPSGRGLEPKRVEHLQLGISWDVTEILDRWEHPGRAEDTLGKPSLIKWWLLKVSGPLPGRPAERGEFVMQVSFYGSPPGWWITAGQDALSAPSTHARRRGRRLRAASATFW